jgi:hypothetical protein
MSSISREYDYFARNQEEGEYLVISIDGGNYHCSDFMQCCMEKRNEFLDRAGLERYPWHPG